LSPSRQIPHAICMGRCAAARRGKALRRRPGSPRHAGALSAEHGKVGRRRTFQVSGGATWGLAVVVVVVVGGWVWSWSWCLGVGGSSACVCVEGEGGGGSHCFVRLLLSFAGIHSTCISAHPLVLFSFYNGHSSARVYQVSCRSPEQTARTHVHEKAEAHTGDVESKGTASGPAGTLPPHPHANAVPSQAVDRP
jgi:hypothetical protein